MKKRRITLIALAALITLLAAAYFGVSTGKRKKQEAATAAIPDYVSITALDPETVNALSAPNEGVVLEKKEGRWELVSPARVPNVSIDQGEVAYYVRSLARLSAEQVIAEKGPQADLAAYGLEPPGATVILRGEDGEETELYGGALTPSKNARYVMVSGDTRVYTASVYSAEKIFFTLNGIRDKSLFASFEDSDLQRFSLVSEKGKWKLDINRIDESQALLNPFSSYMMSGYYRQPRGVDTEKLRSLTAPFKGLKVTDFISTNPSPALTGLDKPLRVSIETSEGKLALLLGNATGGANYAQLPGSEEIVTLAGFSPLAGLRPFDLADKFALLIGLDTVDRIKVSGGEETLEAGIQRSGEEERYYFNGQPAEEQSFKAWYQTVIGLTADAELPDKNFIPREGGLAVEYTLNKSPFKAGIELFPYNRDFYVLRRDGAMEFLVSRGQVKKIFDLLP